MKLYKNFISFLRWSERYTKTDMVYLVQGASWLTLTQIIASLSGFVLLYILANKLTPETLGEYRFLMTGFTLVCVIALPGMRTALRESVPKGYTGNLHIAFWSMFRWGLLSAAISILVASYYFFTGKYELSLGFVIIALIVPIYNAATGYGEFLIAIKSLRQNTIYAVTTRLIGLLVTIGVVLLAPKFAWVILAATLLGTVMPNLIFHVKVLKEHSSKGNPKDPKLKTYAKHLSIMTALGLFAGQLDKILIWNVIGAEALALFYIAQTVPQNITSNLNTIPTLAFAKFGTKDPKVIKATLLPKLMKYFGVIAFICFGYILIAPIIFSWFFPTYLDAIPYSIAFACIPLFGALLPIKTYLTTIKATQALYVISIIPPATRIGVALLLIPSFGLWGVVLSMISEALIRSILLLYYFLRS
ncbi:membrane protein involved in the export of O-antigen and teichoic acid [Rhodobacteraceae bacterium HIMB11]|nr:membrane protein involved in the export of O-antigen and teichoic acid [Rhodobacteraceae bacterium HIMB11]